MLYDTTSLDHVLDIYQNTDLIWPFFFISSSLAYNSLEDVKTLFDKVSLQTAEAFMLKYVKTQVK